MRSEAITNHLEIETPEGLEKAHGDFYMEVLNFLDDGQDIAKVQELLSKIPAQFREKYRHFIGKFREVFQRHEDGVGEILRDDFDSVTDFIAWAMATRKSMWFDQNATPDEMEALAEEFESTAIMESTLSGVYEFLVPQNIINKLAGEGRHAFKSWLSREGKKIYFIMFSKEVTNDGEKKAYRLHEMHHVLWDARDEIVQKKQGNFIEFGDKKTQEDAQTAFTRFQDEIVAYLVGIITAQKKYDITQLTLDLLIYNQANDPSLTPIIQKYLDEIRPNFLQFDQPPHKTYDDLKVYLYPLMAASDFKDMIKRLQYTKAKCFGQSSTN